MIPYLRIENLNRSAHNYIAIYGSIPRDFFQYFRSIHKCPCTSSLSQSRVITLCSSSTFLIHQLLNTWQTTKEHFSKPFCACEQHNILIPIAKRTERLFTQQVKVHLYFTRVALSAFAIKTVINRGPARTKINFKNIKNPKLYNTLQKIIKISLKD